MPNIVIISKNQRSYIPEFVSQLPVQLPGFKVVFVLDKDTDDSSSILKNLNQNYIEQ